MMTKITKTQFFTMCRGAKLVKVENFDGNGWLESTAFTYQRPSGDLIYKIETRGLRACDLKTTTAYYK
jgi:hypothetical protein